MPSVPSVPSWGGQDPSRISCLVKLIKPRAKVRMQMAGARQIAPSGAYHSTVVRSSLSRRKRSVGITRAISRSCPRGEGRREVMATNESSVHK